VAEGALAQVWDLQPITEQIVPVQLDERVQVEQRLDARRGHDHQRKIIDDRPWLGQPPGQGRQRPDEYFEIGPRKSDPQPPRFLREKPRITHVAIKRRLKKQEEKTNLTHVSPKIFAG
jgi:hypothetical protein